MYANIPTDNGSETIKVYIDYAHIFGPVIITKCKNKTFELHGFHQDLLKIIERSNLIKFSDVKPEAYDFYKAKWSYENAQPKDSTFFPAEWTRDKVIEKIYETLRNPISVSIPKEGRWEFFGKIGEEIKIKIIFQTVTIEDGIRTVKIVSAYPEFEERQEPQL